MKKSIKGRKKTLIVCLAVSIFLVEEAARFSAASIMGRKSDVFSLRKAYVLDPKGSDLTYMLGRAYHFYTLGEDTGATRLYADSIKENPLMFPSWFGLAEFFIEEGRGKEGLKVLDYMHKLDAKSAAWKWEEAIVALRLGENDMALKDLRYVAKVDPGRRNTVFDLAFEVFESPRLILDKVVEDEVLPSYFSYLMSKGITTDTFLVWEKMEDRGYASKDMALRYIDFLVGKGKVREAKAIWDKNFSMDRKEIVWNGQFEKEPTGRGFDWRIGKIDGVEIKLDRKKKWDGSYSLKISFSGKENVDFSHVSQVILLEPDTNYVFTSYMSLDGITTKSGLIWEVYCQGESRKLYEVTEPLLGTMGWERIEFSFQTPPDCDAAVIRLRRYRTHKLDRYIRGSAWIDNVSLEKLPKGVSLAED